MSEQTSMTPDEARDLVSKLNGLAAGLSPAQLRFLEATLAAGAESSDVEGHMLGTEAQIFSGTTCGHIILSRLTQLCTASVQ